MYSMNSDDLVFCDDKLRMLVKLPFPEEQDGITMSPVGGRRGAVFRVSCISQRSSL